MKTILSALDWATIKENLLKGLDISWKGILAIFIVITAVCLASVGLNLICKKIEAKKASKNDNDKQG